MNTTDEIYARAFNNQKRLNDHLRSATQIDQDLKKYKAGLVNRMELHIELKMHRREISKFSKRIKRDNKLLEEPIHQSYFVNSLRNL